MSEIDYRPRPFRAAGWLPGPHAQTLAGRYLRAPHGVHYRRERVETPDGDFLDLDFAEVETARAVADDAPLCLVIHGLEGSSRSAYVQETCRVLAESGIRAVAMNFRSCSGEPNRLTRFYHAGDTEDLAFVLGVLRERTPAATLMAMGFSLGANQLLKYLGERGPASLIRAAVAVSIPFDLGAGSDQLDESWIGRIYVRHFVRQLQDKFRHKQDAIGDRLDAARILSARSFREFDDAATSRLHGFRDADDYYTRSSCGPYLSRIRVPTLLVHALDDPFVEARSIPHGDIDANPHLYAAFSRHGGHVGFVAGPPGRPRFWAEAEGARFLASMAGIERA